MKVHSRLCMRSYYVSEVDIRMYRTIYLLFAMQML